MLRITLLFLLSSLGWIAQNWPERSLESLPTKEVRRDLELGSFDHPYLAFSRIADLATDPSGRLYVLQPMDAQVLILDKNGGYAGRIGRRGMGPGEFMSPAALGWIADTLWVMDAGLRRITFFANGEALTSHDYRSISLGTGTSPAAVFPMANGEFLGVLANNQTPPESGSKRLISLMRVDHAGQIQDTLAILRENYPLRHQIGRASTTPLFHDFPLFKVHRSGDYLVVIDRPIPDRGSNRVTLTWVDPSGDTTRVAILTSSPSPISDRQWEQRVARRFDALPGSRIGREEYLSVVRRPPSFPSVSGFIIGGDDRIWIAREDIPDADERTWVALDSSGHPLFEVRLPRSFRLFSARGDELWGVMPDSLDVPWIHKYSVMDSEG